MKKTIAVLIAGALLFATTPMSFAADGVGAGAGAGAGTGAQAGAGVGAPETPPVVNTTPAPESQGVSMTKVISSILIAVAAGVAIAASGGGDSTPTHTP
jgi:hypothetical protein